MTYKDYLMKTHGLTEEQADAIIGGMGENKFYLSTNERIDERFEAQKTKLEAAEKLVEDLKESNSGNEDLQKKVEDYEAELATLKSTHEKDLATFAAREYLSAQGASDVDYALFKLGELEVKDGKFVDFENKVKSLKESAPTQFVQTQDNDPEAPGYRVVDNKLGEGGTGQKLDITKMSAEEINANWDDILKQSE